MNASTASTYVSGFASLSDWNTQYSRCRILLMRFKIGEHGWSRRYIHTECICHVETMIHESSTWLHWCIIFIVHMLTPICLCCPFVLTMTIKLLVHWVLYTNIDFLSWIYIWKRDTSHFVCKWQPQPYPRVPYCPGVSRTEFLPRVPYTVTRLLQMNMTWLLQAYRACCIRMVFSAGFGVAHVRKL